MNRTKILSNDELRLILGNSNLSSALTSIHNQLAINLLCDILQVNNLAEHSVVKEEVTILDDGAVIEFRDFPIQTDTIELYNSIDVRIDSDILYRSASHSDQFVHLVDSQGRKNLLGYKTGEVLASYTAGFQNADILTLTDNPSDTQGFLIDEAEVQTTYTFKSAPSGDTDIQIGASKENTATNVAAKIGGTADGAVVTCLVGQEVVSTDAPITIANATTPEELKFVCAMIAGGSIGHAERANGVVSYRLGQKQVNFRNEREAETAEKILEYYLQKYLPMTVLS